MSSSPTMALHQFSLPQAGTERAGYWRTFPIGSTHFMEVINASKSARTRGGDISASGDETHTKVRKPYTITKQRERWTEEEHQKFLEALKLYGRAWRRIEEHIGSKTAVQIRSHAQKFFSKLEREASTGILAGLAQDIEIPPPRPKRKPNHPYPRKAGSTFSSSLAFEEDEKSSPDDCSDLTALTSPTALGLMPTQVKIARYSPSFTQGSFLTREVSNMQKEESFGSPRKNGLPTSLKLFGQTFTVPESQRADSFEVGTLQLSGKPIVSTSSTESESADSPRSQVLRKDMRFRTLSSPCSCTNENDSKESFVANVQSKGRLENDTSMDLSEMENPSSSLLESAVGAMESVSHSCYSSEEDKSWKHDSEAGTEECMHSAFQSLDEDNHTEESNSHNKVNESNYSYLGTNTSAPFANANRQFFNSMASLCRFPCSPLDNLSKDQEKNQEAPPSCSPSQHQVYGGFENLSESIGERGQDGAKSSFTPWHLSKTATQQNSAIFATPFWPGFVPATSAIHKFGEDAGTTAAIAAASFAAASAWWALQGAVPSGGVHSNMGKLCSPVAVYAASRRPLSISSTSSFESGGLARGQDLNQNNICDIGNMTGDSEHKQGDLRHDKPETSFKTAELPLGYSYMGTSPPRCYSSSENIVAGFYSESSSCDTDFLPAKKRLRSSSADVDASGEESKNSFSGSNTPPADTSFDDSEKSGDENINLPLGYYFVSAQLSRTSSLAEEKCKSTTSLESQNPIVHSTSNSNAPSDRLQDEVASAGRGEKDRGIPQNHGFQKAKENQISNSNGDYGMCAENVQLVEAYDQDDHKLSLQNQAVCPPVSMAEEESQSFVSIEMPSFDLQGKCHGLMCGGTTKEALSKISCTIDSQECNMPTESSELDSTVVPSCLQEGNAGDDQKVAERCSVIRSSFAKDLEMALNTEKDVNNEDSSHVWPSQGRMDAMDEGKRRSSAVVNIGGLVGSQRYSGVGFVPYQRSL